MVKSDIRIRFHANPVRFRPYVRYFFSHMQGLQAPAMAESRAKYSAACQHQARIQGHKGILTKKIYDDAQ
jgi:hypothetical protein